MDNADEFIQQMIDEGCFVPVGDEYQVNWNLLEALHPGFYEVMWQDHISETDAALRNLCDQGLLQMSFDVDPETGKMESIYSLTEAGVAFNEAFKDEPRG